jgi:outer membrane lipoprotein-sorting protein
MPKRRPPNRSRRAALALLLALAATRSASAPGATPSALDFDLDRLMETLAAVRSAEATFVERRTVRELDRTLESSGRLTYQAPDSFTRETLRPHRDKLAVSGNVLTMSRGDRTRTLELDAAPEAQVAVEAIRGTLTGNRALLERLFEVRLDGSESAWHLSLIPRDARLRDLPAQLRVSGREAEIREVAVTLADGDYSVMKIEPVVTGAAR